MMNQLTNEQKRNIASLSTIQLGGVDVSVIYRPGSNFYYEVTNLSKTFNITALEASSIFSLFDIDPQSFYIKTDIGYDCLLGIGKEDLTKFIFHVYSIKPNKEIVMIIAGLIGCKKSC